jgi:hypothetical protein
MTFLRYAVLALLLQATPGQRPPEPPATASVEGVVVRLGTNEPIADADVELTRVEGTEASPLAPGAAEVLARALVGGGNSGPTPPAPLLPEVRYVKTGADGKYSFQGLKEGKYRLVSIWIGGTYHPAEYGQRDPRGRGLNFPVSQGQAVKDTKLEMAPTGVIAGRVVDAEGQPMGHVSVMALEPLMKNGRRYLAIMQAGHTDEQGEFRLFWLSPGRYYIAARIEDFQRRTLPMYVIPPGRGEMNERATGPVLTRRRVPTGEIVEETYTMVYAGGVLTPEQSQMIELKPGQTFGGVDIPMARATTRAFHIRGTVLSPTGQPTSRASVVAIPRQWSPNVLVMQSTVDANGAFDLKGAVQGGYNIYATASDATNVSQAMIAAAAAAGVPLSALGGGSVTTGVGLASVDISGADIDNLRIATTPGMNVTGRVTIEGRTPGVADPDIPKIRIGLTRDPDIMTSPAPFFPLPPPGPNAPPTPQNGQVIADGSFRMLTSPGNFRVSVTGNPPNTYVKSVQIDNTDILANGLQVTQPQDRSLEIVIGTDGGEITGIVQNGRGEPVTNAVVALVPESVAQRKRIDLYRNITTDFAGKFQLKTVAPGTYKLFSWEYVDNEIWEDPQFLQPYETFGQTITLRPGGKQDVQLPVISIRR